MKQFIQWTGRLALAGLILQCNTIAFAQFFGGMKEQRVSLNIKSDGSSALTNNFTLPRTVAEQQVRMMERMERMNEGEGLAAVPSATETNQLTDDELTQKLRALLQSEADDSGDGSDVKSTIQVDKDVVRVARTREFATLDEMLKNGYSLWSESGLSFENVRFEITNSQLRVTLTPYAAMARYARRMRQQWKLTETQVDFRLILPGKILSSGFPETTGNSTGILIDGKKDESVDAALKLYDAPTVITAETGGLKLAQPLESKALQRIAQRGGREPGENLPTTDAGPGFLAEALSVTTTTLHVFPGGEKYFKENSEWNQPSAGTVIRTKFFVPKGRTLQSVSGVRVLKATDDKGRAIASGGDSDASTTTFAFSSGSQQADSTQIELRLQLPEPDAQAIDELAAEAIAVTAGSWKEMTLTNLQENATNEIDLAGVLPDAKLIVTKFSSTNNQVRIQADLRGPATIRQLDVQAKIPGREQFHSSMYERSFRTLAGRSSRSIVLQGYSYGNDRGSDTPIVVVIRYPQDLRRERVNFKLKGLDLL